MAKKIFVGNYKGGVGKTTFTYNFGCELKKRNKENKVLLIDLDPQSSLSEVCLREKSYDEFENLNYKETFNYVVDIYYKANKEQVYSELNLDINKLIKDNGHVHYINSSYLYKDGGLDIQCLNMVNKPNNILIIKRFLNDSKLDEKYDYIIFDCPPSNNIITQSAFFASDYYIMPTIMDAISSRGVRHYKEIFDKYYKKYMKSKVKIADVAVDDEPKLLGVFESKRKANSKTDTHRESIESNFYLFKQHISDYKEVSDRLEKGEPSEKAEYPALVDEILKRIEYFETKSFK
ncbi:ParA family protein [Clostridium sp.]|uniref:ParA family protein n=1 Tax=Clostridium sp. TaxID=1506 RepID=UPI003F3F8070